MARRKRMLDDGDDSDSDKSSEDPDFNTDPDAREERALFENPYKNKRRRKNGKEDALYGIFADNSNDENLRKAASASRTSNWTKAPSFVTGEKPVNLEELMQVDSSKEESDDTGSESSEAGEDGKNGVSKGEGVTQEYTGDSNHPEPSRLSSPRVPDEDDQDTQPTSRLGGIGSATSHPRTLSSFSTGSGIDSSRNEFIEPHHEQLKGGIGSRREHDTNTSRVTVENSTDESRFSDDIPSSAKVPSSFARKSANFSRATNVTSNVPLPADEMAHFNKIQGSFGARMLAKMGWQAGSGLGQSGDGIVVPIESKLRPQKMGIAFKGFKEKTEQSKLEARRRGEIVSDDEDEKVGKQRKEGKARLEKRSDAWRKPKKVKMKTEHKTYEQIIEEAGEASTNVGIGQIIDATGAVPREVSSLADISINSWSPLNDLTRIPEVRHNISLIADACKSDLDGLAREAKALQERKKFVISEDARLRKKVEGEAELIARLQQIQIVANDISDMAKTLLSTYQVSLTPFSPLFEKLMYEFTDEYDKYHLDELVVAAMAPVMRRMTSDWNPLDDPTRFLATLKTWRRALKINAELPTSKVDLYGLQNVGKADHGEIPMTPFETLLWNVWLPKVRTSINNEWLPEDALPAVKLYEAWSSFLPAFIRDNLLDQLILPKLQKSVASWNIKKSKVPLHSIVFPWLSHVGLRFEEVVSDARRKIKNVIRNWAVDEPIPSELLSWKNIFDKTEWDAVILKYVVPKLAATLRNDFRVNPRDQKMEPLQRTFEWTDMIRPSILSQILEAEFFPKWLDVLHLWLIQPRVSFEEVAQWYSFWKDVFPESIRNLPGVHGGFTQGLQLMNKAIELGPDAPTKLAKPDFIAEPSAPCSPAGGRDTDRIAKLPARTHEITFRSIVEEYAASHNLLFIPTGKTHEISRMPLFRVSRTTEGRKGLLVYILDDAVWAPNSEGGHIESEEFKAIGLEDMVLKAM